MSKLQTRLTQLEKQTPADPPRIFIYHQGDDFGTCNQQTMTRADWDQTKNARDYEIVIRTASEFFSDEKPDLHNQ